MQSLDLSTSLNKEDTISSPRESSRGTRRIRQLSDSPQEATPNMEIRKLRRISRSADKKPLDNSSNNSPSNVNQTNLDHTSPLKPTHLSFSDEPNNESKLAPVDRFTQLENQCTKISEMIQQIRQIKENIDQENQLQLEQNQNLIHRVNQNRRQIQNVYHSNFLKRKAFLRKKYNQNLQFLYKKRQREIEILKIKILNRNEKRRIILNKQKRFKKMKLLYEQRKKQIEDINAQLQQHYESIIVQQQNQNMFISNYSQTEDQFPIIQSAQKVERIVKEYSEENDQNIMTREIELPQEKESENLAEENNQIHVNNIKKDIDPIQTDENEAPSIFDSLSLAAIGLVLLATSVRAVQVYLS